MTKPKGGVALSTMTAGWLLPAVAPIVAAATGASVAAVLNPYQALVTIMVSLALLGLGLPMALVIITVYFHRLTTHGLPPLEHMASVFLPLGPLGQGGYAAQKLGAQALKTLVAMDSLPAVGSVVAGQVFYVVGFIFAWILWGFGTVWLFFAIFSISPRKFPFGLGWWAFTFPLGVYAMSTLTLGQELPSLFMRIVGTILGIQVMINWLFLAVVMFSKLMSGHVWDVFKAPELYGDKNQRWEYE
jgi:tellurite resistance protein TehA-like permease